MPGPLDFLMQPATTDQTARAGELAPAPPAPADGGQPLDFLFKPQEQRSASEIVQRGEFANRDWKDTAAELKKSGYAAPDEIGTQYEQRRALRAEKEKQGTGVGTFEQYGRHGIPVISAILNGRREGANYEAAQRFQQGKATPEDMQTLAAYQRRQQADQAINSTTAGQLLSIPLTAPAVIGEGMIGGKLLSLGGKVFGFGKAAATTAAAANPSTARVALNFAGKQALAMPLVPSLYVQKANEINARENRTPNDIRGYPPALALAYSQMLVLGSLSKFGNSGSFADQVIQKGAIGVGEQAIADTGISAVDEFLPKAYQTGTKYGVLGNLARGEVGEGLKQATTQMLTFSYFAALHGKTPDHAADAYRNALSEQFKAGANADAAAQAVDVPRQVISDALARNPDLTRAEARDAIDAVNKSLPRPMSGANVDYGYALADTLPKQKPEGPKIKPGSLLERTGKPEEAPPSLTRVDHWTGEAPPEVEPAEGPPEAPESPPVDPIDAMHPEDHADLAKSLGVKEKGLKDPKIVDFVRGLAEKAIADRAAREKPPEPQAPEAPPQPEAPARSAGEENAPPRMEGVQLSAGRVTGEKDHQGNPLTVHDLVNGQGKHVGEAKVFQSGGTLHVHWIGVNGMAGGEGRGKNPIGARELLRLLPELAKAYPDAVVAKYTPAAGRINAGETKWIDLQKVRERGTIGAKPAAEPTPEAAPEAPPSRTFTPFEKTAPDAVSSLPTTIPPKVTAERRSAPRLTPEQRAKIRTSRSNLPASKDSDVTTPEEVAISAQNQAGLHPGGGMPPEVLARHNELFGTLAKMGVDRVDYLKGKAEAAYRKYGPDGYDAVVSDYDAKLKALAEEVGEPGREETADEAAEREDREAESKIASLKEIIESEKSVLAARYERLGQNRDSARRRAEESIREADAIADTPVVRSNPSEATEPQKPRSKKGSNLTPAGKVQKVLDGSADADAKAAIEDALHNFRNRDPHELAAAIGRSVEASYSSVGGHVDREVSPAAVKLAAKALKSLGAVEHGPAVGEQATESAHYYEPAPGSANFRFGAKLTVVRRPLTLNDAVVMRGVLAEVKTPKTKGGKGPRTKTVVDDVKEEGGIKADSSLEDTADLVKEFPGLFTSRPHAMDIHQMAEKLGFSSPDELLQAMRKKVPSKNFDNTKAQEADLQRYWREQEEAAKDRGDTQTWRPSEEEIPFSTEPGKEVLGPPSLTRVGDKGAFEIIAAQNKLFDVRNYVEKSVPYNKSALAVALREQEATVTSKIAAGDPLVNLEEHAHHLQKALGLPESPDGLPLVVARGIQEFYKPGVPTRMGMIEGFAKWLRLRSTGGLTGLSREQEVANQYYERWAAEKGLTKTFDQIRDMYAKYQSRPASEQAAGNVSATGKPVEADRTAAEVATSIGQKAQEVVDDNLSVLQRVIASANKAGHAVGQRLYNAYSQLMHASPRLAAQFEKEGVHGYDKDGRRIVLGQSWDKIVEGAKPEWLRPGANGEASKAGTYATVRHILGEEARGRKELVSEVQLEQARRALAEFHADAEFAAWAKPFAERLTAGFNASNRALASPGVHFYSTEEVDASEKKYPDYVPTTRVLQDAGWKAGGGTRGEIIGKGLFARSGSGEQIVDPLISYKNRLAKTASRMTEQLKRKELFKVLELPGMGDWAILGEKTLTQLGKERAERLSAIGFKGEDLKRILEDMGSERDEEYFTTKPWPTDGSKPTLGMMGPDGNLVTARIGNKALYDLATGQQVEASALASWLKATGEFYPIKLMTQAVKFGATSASLGFQFRNVPRDIYTFWSNTIDRTKANPRDLGDAYKRAFAFAWHQLTGHFGYAPSTDVLFRRFESERGEGTRQFDFNKDNPASAYGPDRGKVVQTAHTIWGILKDVLRTAGAGELAPRFLEWKTRLMQTTGKTEAQLTAELDAAEKAAAEGKPIPDPIPLAVGLDALQHASEVTVNFNRLGTVTREVNKITPFFGPAIAGLSKQVRNWKENPKGAAFALSGLLAARLIHWALFSDEDWYKELSANDRFNNFVVPTPAGLRRFPAPRGLEVAGGGFLTTVLDAAAAKNPDLKGYLKESYGSVAPPLPVPPAAKVGYELAKNENWMGSPIVPKREEATSASQKLLGHQLPYAADQMTGGLLSERKIPKGPKDFIPYSEVRNARRSVDTFYERLKELEAARQDARQKGVRYADEAEYHRLEAAGKRITELSREIRGERLVNGRVVKGAEPGDDKKAELRKRQVEMARKALEK